MNIALVLSIAVEVIMMLFPTGYFKMSFAQTIVSPKPLETFSAKELIDL
jgi:hypothetical protein